MHMPFLLLIFFDKKWHNVYMEENIILWLQRHSSKFLDLFMRAESYLVSWIGALFMFFMIILFIDKKYGLFFGVGFLFSIGVNFCLKEIIARPRPYVANPEIINKLTTIGKSFPSGHSVSVVFIVLTLLYLFYYLNKKGKFKLFNKVWFKILSIFFAVVLIILTGISRMYLGQHYITDILAGLMIGAIGFLVTFLLVRKKLVKTEKE